MNTFADRMNLPRAQDMPCMVKVAKAKTKFPGAIYIEFYVDDKAEKECIKKGMWCHTPDDAAPQRQNWHQKQRNLPLIRTDRRKKFRRANFCVSPDGRLLGEKNCYVALNPDWLFN